MKSIIDLSPFTKQFILSNRTTVRKPNNNKYYISSNQTLNFNANSNDKNNRNIKNNVSKNNYINKTQIQSKEKSKSKSKSRDEIYLTNKILKSNLKYPVVSSLNDKYSFIIRSSSKSDTQRTYNNLTIRIYENVLDKLFLYMKKILPNDTYKNIKNKFIGEISKELNNYSNRLNIHNDSSITSSITNLIKATINNSINIDDFSSINNNHHNNNKVKFQLSYNLGNNNVNIISSNRINPLIKKHSSLYTLTKSKILNSKTVSNSKSKSKSKSNSKSRSNSKGINEFNKSARNSKKNYLKKYTFIGNNKATLNSKLFDKINAELLKIDFKPISTKKILIDKNKGKNSYNNNNKKTNSPNTKNIHNRNNKINNTSSTIIINGNNSHTSGNSLKKKEKHIKSNFSLNFNKNNVNKITENSKSIEKKKEKNKNVIIKEIINESKNSEQLKEIKSSLDENLKVMFNFSYEDFLNKESETESKKSIDENNNNISRGVYKSKYQV